MSLLNGDGETTEIHIQRKRILVVDDKAQNRELLGRFLARNGYDVVLRETAETIEHDVAAEKIDLVLLDWMMPQRSGRDALAGLRALHDLERLPVVVVTALENGEIVARVLQAGANDYVSKPIDFQVLMARIQVQLERKAAVVALSAIKDDLEETVRLRTQDLSAANDRLSAEIAEREAAEEHARAMALHDALTGLPNRRHLQSVLGQLLAEANSERRFAIVAIDLDRFKPVNDLYGHAVGDELLVSVAKLLADEAEHGGFAARLGGDEFILVLPYPTDEELIGRLSRLISRFDAPFQLGHHEVSAGVSLGIATPQTDSADAEALMRQADIALYRAKQDGRGRFSFFESGMDALVQERALLERDLRQAVRSDAIDAYFQPLVQLGTAEVRGYEILARWPHPERGLIQPDVFIPLAEEIGLIGELTLNVLRRACRTAVNWPGAPRLSVNIAPVQLRDRALAQKILKILTECAFPAARLEIEITESGLVSDFEDARCVLQSFKNLGMQIALDDFGTGYSSLRHLRELPFDVIKIDKSFILGMSNSDEARSMVKTIIDMAKNLSLHVTAEGIETAAHASDLLSLGCDLGQGYYFGHPHAADEAPTMGPCNLQIPSVASSTQRATPIYGSAIYRVG